MKADLHIHSTYSDGIFSPSEIVAKAVETGVEYIAISDHDCIDGLEEAITIGSQNGITVIPAVELSCTIENTPGEIHILGYLHKYNNKQLSSFLKRYANARKQRIKRILNKLKELGIDIPMSEVEEIAGNGTLGRPHIARLLVKRGISVNTGAAFYRYLGEGAAAYVPKEPLSVEGAITIIHKMHGLAVWAHPKLEQIRIHLTRFRDAGLDGLEGYHPQLEIKNARKIRRLASKFGMLVTGGSDFHSEQRNGSFGSFTVGGEAIQPFLDAYFNISE
ncbi:MAG: PHP domain-containing protein [Acidobacteria bacterium]|nr:PHP domain-containing protein [Acidobacteriota bacterium]